MAPGNDGGRSDKLGVVNYQDQLDSDVVNTELRAEGHSLPTIALADERSSEGVTMDGGDVVGRSVDCM